MSTAPERAPRSVPHTQARDTRDQALFACMINGLAHCRMVYEGNRPVDFIYLDVNEAFSAQTGLRDVVGRRVSEVIPGIWKHDPELLAIYGRVAQTGLPERFEWHLKSLDAWFDVSVYSPALDEFVAIFDVITERKRVEHALRASEARHRMLFETNPLGIVYQDRDGRILSANPAAERILGLSLDQMQGRTSTDPRWQAIHENGSPFPGESHPTMVALRTGAPVRDVVMGIFNPGTEATTWIRVEAVPLFKEGSPLPSHVYALFRDITEKRAAEALRSQHRELTLITETIPVMLWSSQPDGSVDYLNQAWLDQCGITLEQGLGTGWLSHVHPDDVASAAAAWEDARREAKAHEVEMRLRRPDGSYTWCLARARPLKAPDGTVLRWFGANVDITARKQALQELQATSRAFEALYNHAPCGYHSIDASGTVIAINDTQLAMHGYTREEVVGRMNIRQLVNEATRAQFPADFEAFLQAGRIRNVEAVFVRKDGSEFPVLLSADAQFAADGTFLHSLTTIIDDTERREALRELREARSDLERRVVERTAQVRALAEEVTRAEERERRALAHDLHDGLGQMLFAIALRVDNLIRDLAPSTGPHASLLDVKTTLGEARRMLRSITGQLSPLVLETLGLAAGLAWLGDEMRSTYGLAVDVRDEGGGDGLSPAAAAIVYRTVRELLINIAKHAGTKEAKVLLGREEDHLAVQVEDAGQGISDVEAALASPRTHGLRAMRERMAFLGGTFRIWSRLGCGTIITLRIPYPEEAEP